MGRRVVCSFLLLSAVSFILIGTFIESVQGEETAVKPNSTDHANSDNDHVGGNNNSTKGHGDEHHDEHGGHRTEGLTVASVNYAAVRDPLIFTIVILVAGVSKIGYHHSDFLSSIVPESCILIVLGTVFGAIIFFSDVGSSLPTFFKPHEFFIYLLPPLILEASYSLHDRTFGENLGSILLFAVVGTILAAAFMGVTLYGLAKGGAMGSIPDMSFVEIMVFASLIVAVDPVAVLAVFNEIGVNHVLYFLVFGESLLNDGVTVVLYKVFQSYNVMEEITGVHVLIGIVKFFVVCFGGLALGILAGLATALLTKATQHVKVAQPLVIYTMAYLGFLLAELFEFSGIISIVGCGLTQRQYAFHNISDKSSTTIKYFTKVISTACEIVIFMFLGLSMVTDKHNFHAGFTIWTLVLCFVYRFIIIFGITFLINWLDIYRVRKINFHEQFMIAYGGLRGAVCFSLCALLHPAEFPQKNMFITTTLAVIIFTVFVQGITIKPLVHLLRITLAPEKNSSMYVELTSNVTDHLMAGMENIIGDHGKNHLREKLDHLDTEYLQPIFTVQPDPGAAQLKEFYEHLVLKEHLKYLKLSGAKDMQHMPDLPHVTTELFLSSMGHQKSPVAPPEEEKPQEEKPSSPTAARVPEVTFVEPEVQVRRRTSYSPNSKTDIVNQKGLRNLLMNQQDRRLTMKSFDRNLTKGGDFGTEIKKKSHANKRLERMMTTLGLEADNGQAKRRSWSEMEGEACKTRGELSTRSKPPPRHCVTMDLSSGDDSGRDMEPVPLLPLTPQEEQLASVHEADEEAETEITPMISGGGNGDDDDDHSDDDVEDSEREKKAAMKRRRSSKNQLKRQGGMDQQSGTNTSEQKDD